MWWCSSYFFFHLYVSCHEEFYFIMLCLYFRREKLFYSFLLANFCLKLIVIALEIDSNYEIREKYFQMTSLSTSWRMISPSFTDLQAFILSIINMLGSQLSSLYYLPFIFLFWGYFTTSNSLLLLQSSELFVMELCHCQ